MRGPVGVDWRTPLDVAWQRIGEHRAIQGNLDPAGDSGSVGGGGGARARRAQPRGRRLGHVFNLGHGVMPTTPVARSSGWSTSCTTRRDRTVET